MCKVLQQALSVVDGGVELRIGVLPLPIQILSTQRTTMTTAERRRRKRGKDIEWRRREQQLENPSRQDFVCVNKHKAVTNVQAHVQQMYASSVCILESRECVFITFHL